jgi:hypothetical protein
MPAEKFAGETPNFRHQILECIGYLKVRAGVGN